MTMLATIERLVLRYVRERIAVETRFRVGRIYTRP